MLEHGIGETLTIDRELQKPNCIASNCGIGEPTELKVTELEDTELHFRKEYPLADQGM